MPIYLGIMDSQQLDSVSIAIAALPYAQSAISGEELQMHVSNWVRSSQSFLYKDLEILLR